MAQWVKALVVKVCLPTCKPKPAQREKRLHKAVFWPRQVCSVTHTKTHTSYKQEDKTINLKCFLLLLYILVCVGGTISKWKHFTLKCKKIWKHRKYRVWVRMQQCAHSRQSYHLLSSIQVFSSASDGNMHQSGLKDKPTCWPFRTVHWQHKEEKKKDHNQNK